MEEEEAVAQLGETQEPVADIAATIPAMVFAQVEAHGAETIIRKKDRGIWKTTSWSELGKTVRQVAMALKEFGFRPGEVACVLAPTSPAWVVTDLGILCAGGISAGLYTHRPGRTGAGDAGRMRLPDRVRRQRGAARHGPADQGRLPGAREDRHLRYARPARLQRSDVRELSGVPCPRRGLRRRASARLRDEPRRTRRRAGRGADLHGGHIGSCQGRAAQPSRRSWRRPPRPRRCSASVPATSGWPSCRCRISWSACSASIRRFDAHGQQLRRERRERRREPARGDADACCSRRRASGSSIYAAITVAATRGDLPAAALFNWAIGGGVGASLILRSVRRRLGLDRLRIGCIGGAPVSPALIRWYRALGIDLVGVLRPERGRRPDDGDAGRSAQRGKQRQVVSGGELKISPTGELLVRDENIFSGYWRAGGKAERSTNGGWFSTGDTRAHGRRRDAHHRAGPRI